MNLNDAIGTLISAAEMRRDQWDQAATGSDLMDVVDELYEADTDECQNMAGLITDALRTVRGATGPLYTDEEATTAMAMWEWVMRFGKGEIREFFDHGGASETRSHFLRQAHILDEAWSVAHEQYGYDDAFDWDFIPAFLQGLVDLTIRLADARDNLPAIFEEMGLELQEITA